MTFRPILLAALGGILASFPAKAIINIEELRMDETQPGWASSSTLAFNGQRGNIHEDKFSLNGGVQWNREDLQVRNLILFTVNRSQAEGTTFSEDYFGHLRHTRQLNDMVAWEVFTQYQEEPLNDSYRRRLAGTNARFPVEQPFIHGYFGAGVMYEERRVIPAELAAVERDDVRFNFYLNSRYELSENAELALSFYLQPSVDDLADTRSIVNLGITSRVTRLFSLTLDLSYSNESEPLVGQAHDAWSYSMGVNLSF
ncbi:MAG: DUF481 domain-containing protein [Idiomarina sp.]|nr:DUF481 domain-containing protein [Idiomarina sp.]